MPIASIRTGMVDFVMAATDMAQKLIGIRDNALAIVLPVLGDGKVPFNIPCDAAANAEAEEAMQKVLTLLRVRTGHDFRNYKRATVLRRIERRLQVRGVPNLPTYHRLLESDATEPQALL